MTSPFPPLKQNYTGPPGDGLCHAYHEYEGLDCLQPAGHTIANPGEHHGDPDPRR